MKYSSRVALLWCIMSSTSLTAQVADVFSFYDGRSVHLRWRSERSISDPRFSIIREDLQDHRRDTLSTPDLMRHSRVADIRRLAGTKANAYFALFGKKNIESDIDAESYRRVFTDKTSRNLFGAIAAATPEFARVLGEVFSDSSIHSSHLYRYTIISIVDSKSSEIGTTAEISTDSPAAVPISTDLEITAQDQASLLSWSRDNRAAQNGEVVSWNVYRSDNVLGPYIRINAMPLMPMQFGAESKRQSFSDEFLTNSKTYYYHIRALNVVGIESAPSTTVVSTPMKPIASPRNVTARQVGEQVILEWQAVLEGSIDNYYRIQRMENSTHATVVDTCPSIHSASTITYIDKAPPTGTLLAYTIQAIRAEESSAVSDTVFIVCQDYVAPSNPLNVRATVRDSIITLSWQKPLDSDVVGYNIYRVDALTDDVVSFKLNAAPVTATTYVTVATAMNQLQYKFSVSAVDRALNESIVSEPVTVRLVDKVPPPMPVISSLHFRDSILQVEWSMSDAADLLEYNIYIIEQSGVTTHLAHSRGTRYETIVHNQLPFSVRVSASDSSHNESQLSQGRHIDPLLYTAPAAPRLISVSQANGSIEIRWSRSLSSNCVGYGLWKVLPGGERVSMKELGPEADRYLDEVSDPEVSQQYILCAFTADGKLSPEVDVKYDAKK